MKLYIITVRRFLNAILYPSSVIYVYYYSGLVADSTALYNSKSDITTEDGDDKLFEIRFMIIILIFILIDKSCLIFVTFITVFILRSLSLFTP